MHFNLDPQAQHTTSTLMFHWENMSVFFNAPGQRANAATRKACQSSAPHKQPCEAQCECSGDQREEEGADSSSVTTCNTIKTIKSHKWTCHFGTLSIRHQSGGRLWGASTSSSCGATPLERPLAHRVGTYLYATVFPPCTAAWSDALLIFLYEQLLALMKLGPMRRASSGRDRPHSSWFDSRTDTGALRWQRLSRWVAVAFLFALSTQPPLTIVRPQKWEVGKAEGVSCRFYGGANWNIR